MLATFVTLFALLVLANAVEKNVTSDKPDVINITAGDDIVRSKPNRALDRSDSSDQDNDSLDKDNSLRRRGAINFTFLPDNISADVKKVLNSSLDLCKFLLRVDPATLPKLEDITAQIQAIDDEDDGDSVMNNTNITKQIRLLLLVSDIAMFCDFNSDVIDPNATQLVKDQDVKETVGFRGGFRRGYARGYGRGAYRHGFRHGYRHGYGGYGGFGGYGYYAPFYNYGYAYPYAYPYYGYGYPSYGYDYGYGYPFYGYGYGGYGYPFYGNFYGGYGNFYGGYGGYGHGYRRGMHGGYGGGMHGGYGGGMHGGYGGGMHGGYGGGMGGGMHGGGMGGGMGGGHMGGGGGGHH